MFIFFNKRSYQLGHMQAAPRSTQVTTPAPHHSSFFKGRMPFLPHNQQRQCTEGTDILRYRAFNYRIVAVNQISDANDGF